MEQPESIKFKLFSEIEKLELPKEHFVVVGSGILAAKGIRQHNDIDLFLSKELFNELKKEGWNSAIVTFLDGLKREKLTKGRCEAYDSFEGKTFENFLSTSNSVETINGIMFLSLNTLIDLKRKWGREKDKEDLELIEKYLSKL